MVHDVIDEQPVNILVGGTVVEFDPPRVEKKDVAILGDSILGVGSEVPANGLRIDVSGCLVMPAFVVGHTHLYSALACGMPPPAKPPTRFSEILDRVWWRLDRALDDDLIHLSALVGAAEAARRGVTCVVDHHASPNAIDGSLDRVADALDAIGVRGVLCYETTDRNGKDGRDAGLRENERFSKRSRAKETTHAAMIGAHAPFTLEDDSLDLLRELVKSTNTPLHVHVAEDSTDAGDARNRRTTLDVRLERLGAYSPGSIIAHGVHLDRATLDRIEAAGAYVVTNARSNMNNAVGLAPAKNKRVALGTDGIGADMIAEAQAHFFRHVEANDGTANDAVHRLAIAQEMAAARFGEEKPRIARGARADICILHYDAPTPIDASNIASHLLFALSSAHVRDTIAGGKFVLRDRKLVNIDERDLASRAREGAVRLWKKMESL